MTDTRLSHGDTSSAKVQQAIDDAATLDILAVAGLPTAASSPGKLVYCSNGANGSPCLAYSNGTSWLRVVLGAAVSAT